MTQHNDCMRACVIQHMCTSVCTIIPFHLLYFPLHFSRAAFIFWCITQLCLSCSDSQWKRNGEHPHSNKEAFKQNNNPPQWLASSVQYVNLVSKDVLHFKTKQLKPAIVTVWAFPVEFTACFSAANLVGTVCIKTTLHTRAVQNKLPFPFFHIFFVLVKPQHQYYLYILDK